MPRPPKNSTSSALARRAIGVWLMVDGVLTGMWFSQLADSLGGRDAVSVAAMVARVIVAALSTAAGWLITQQRPQGAPLGTAALILMSALGLFGTWTGALPSNLAPSLRWPATLVQATIAILAALFLRHDTRENSTDGSAGT